MAMRALGFEPKKEEVGLGFAKWAVGVRRSRKVSLLPAVALPPRPPQGCPCSP